MARNHQFRVDLGYAEEMGFRSHLFFDEFKTSSGELNSLSRSRCDHPHVSDVVDTLSDQFSSLSLLRPKPRPISTPPSSLQSLRPNKGPKAHQRLYRERPKLEPFYELHLSRLRKNESQQDRAKVLQRQEERLYKRGLVHCNGNALRESVGTGVFHPLQRPTTTTSVKKQNQSNRNESEKELCTKEIRGVMTSTRQEQQQMDECHYHLPSDMDFSKDWTF